MTNTKQWTMWGLALAVTLGLSTYLVSQLFGADKRLFAPGSMTDGHHQLEAACDACHTPFAAVKQRACLRCHQAELVAAQDSHRPELFDDPRNADTLTLIDARRCITCHTEHRPQRTRSMGVTVAPDFCFRCHANVVRERPSHRDFDFNGCASAGCHRYHDNTALNEDFLARHVHEPAELPRPLLPMRHLAPLIRAAGLVSGIPLHAADHDAPPDDAEPGIVRDWATTAHARSGVNCSGCHVRKGVWQEHPPRQQCATCHEREVSGFLEGKHGARLRQELAPMTPRQARLPMRRRSLDDQFSCNTCHRAHRYDTTHAAVAGCLGCHDDRHSRAYRDSPHGRLWRRERDGLAARGTGVSCATCHLPREIHHAQVRVQHDQNAKLRPNEKMIRTVCTHCHGVGFSIDALADRRLVEHNFAGTPERHIRSIDMVAARAATTHPRVTRRSETNEGR